MSRITLSVLACCVALGGAGCSSHSSELIDYQVTGGLSGHGDGSSLTLDTDGTGTRTTATGGTTPVTLDPTALDDLNAKIRDAQFATLQPVYGCNGCVDQLVYQIAVQVAGNHYQVSIDESATSTDGLRALLATLKQIAPP